MTLMSSLLTFVLIVAIHMIFAETETESTTASASLWETKPLRTQNMKKLWDRVSQHIARSKQDSLYPSLLEYDQELLKLKHNAINGNVDVVRQQNVYKKIGALLKKYSLTNTMPKEWLQHAVVNPEPASFFAHNRHLQKLYQKAVQLDYTESELEIFVEQLKHFEHRLQKIEQEQEQLNQAEDEASAQERKQKLILEQRQVQRQLQKLELQLTDQDSQDAVFHEERASGLWREAQQVGFSPDELADVKKELSHFERALKKQRSLTDLARAASDPGPRDKQQDDAKIHNRLNDFNKTVKKMYSHLRKRVDKQSRRHGGEL